MKVMVIIKATQRSEAELKPDDKLLAELQQYYELLTKEGILLLKDELRPSSKGTRVRFSGTNRIVISGPFAETNELVAGIWKWNVNSLDEAIDWIKRCPNPMFADSEVEIREIVDAEVSGEVIAPDLHEREAGIRAEALGLGVPRFENGRELLIAGLKQSYMFVSHVHIPSQWERFRPQIDRIPGRVGHASFGVCSSFKRDEGFDYLSGVEVSQAAALSDELITVRIPPQRYAVFNHRGSLSSLEETIGSIWNRWLPDCGLKVETAPCLERYLEDFDSRTGLGGMEIWIPIQK